MSRLTNETWLEFENRELDAVTKSLEAERKDRSKRELVLVITCLLALVYTYPIHNFQTNPNIEIPAISLKLPLRDALAIFPTLIAAIYLVYLASAINEATLMIQRLRCLKLLAVYRHNGEIPDESVVSRLNLPNRRYLLLPTPLHRRAIFYAYGQRPRAVVEAFVGFVFTLLPYGTNGFLVIKSWQLIQSRIIVSWNVICVIVMVLAFASAIRASRTPWAEDEWEG